MQAREKEYAIMETDEDKLELMKHLTALQWANISMPVQRDVLAKFVKLASTKGLVDESGLT